MDFLKLPSKFISLTYKKLKDIAERARKEAVGLSTTERADLDATLVSPLP
jgi:hypothetical protein